MEGSQDRSGFTLVELLVTVTLIGAISVALFGGLRFGTRAWESGTERSERFAQVEIGQSLLRRQLEQALVQQNAEGDGTFVGENDRLTFTAPAPSQFGLGGIYRFDLSLERRAGQNDLVLRWQLYRPDEDTAPFDPTIEQRTLIEKVEEVEFAYFGSRRGRNTPRWHSNWVEEEVPPGLVTVRLEFARNDPRRWPEFSAAPMSAALGILP